MLYIRFPQKIIWGKTAYHDLSQTPQKWKFCALGTTLGYPIKFKHW